MIPVLKELKELKFIFNINIFRYAFLYQITIVYYCLRTGRAKHVTEPGTLYYDVLYPAH